MTETSTKAPRAALGVGKIVGDSFSILFSKLAPIMLLGAIPTFAVQALNLFAFGPAAVTGEFVPGDDVNSILTSTLVSTFLNLVISALVTSLLVLLAYDAKLGRNVEISRYFGPALRALLPVALLSLAIGVLAGLGFLALVIPGLLVYAMFYVTVPAIVIEGAGFGGMGRSATLTKEYRWPIIGLFLLVSICAGLLNAVIAFIAGLLASGTGMLVMIALLSIGSAVVYGLMGVATSLTYARLREIKEGVSVESIASVFD